MYRNSFFYRLYVNSSIINYLSNLMNGVINYNQNKARKLYLHKKYLNLYGYYYFNIKIKIYL